MNGYMMPMGKSFMYIPTSGSSGGSIDGLGLAIALVVTCAIVALVMWIVLK